MTEIHLDGEEFAGHLQLGEHGDRLVEYLYYDCGVMRRRGVSSGSNVRDHLVESNSRSSWQTLSGIGVES